jgi:hypothetical protein
MGTVVLVIAVLGLIYAIARMSYVAAMKMRGSSELLPENKESEN